MSTIETTTEVVHVDPATLLIGTNVRTDVRADAKEFARSIKQRGVLEVITAYRDDDSNLVVLRGQRRAVVAAEVGTPTGTVPVRVEPTPDDMDRIIDQMTENLHRAAMSDTEVVAGVEQLALLGVSAAQIAKKTAITRPHVDAALTVANSETGRQRLATENLTLLDAAVFAEFEGDEAGTDYLVEALESGEPVVHAAQRLRDERTEREELRAEVERLRADGVPALDPDDVPDGFYGLALSSFVDSAGESIPEEQWPSVTGAAVVVRKVRQYDDEEEGREVAPRFDADWIVADPAAAGLVKRWAYDPSSSVSAETPEQEEAKRAERQRVIVGNKAWRSAEVVRREWLASFIARKTPPTGAEALICDAVLVHTGTLSHAMDHHHLGLLKLLGEKPEGYYGDIEACEHLATTPATPKAFTMRTLAAVIAAWEHRTGVHTWRLPTAWDARVMGALIEWGYEGSSQMRV